MKPEAGESTSNHGPGLLTPARVTRIHSSLEPLAIAQNLDAVCSEVLGPCKARVFVLVEDERTQVVRFGSEEEPKRFKAPNLGGKGLFGKDLVPIEDDGKGNWHALLPLDIEGEALGILQFGFEREIASSEMPILEEVTQVMAVAVRNAQIFEKTKRLTFTDDLTALYNSRFMALYLDRELKRCRRMRSSLSLLFMDLDGFKSINDTHGHLAGSRTLVEVGEALERTVRDADVLIRYGGDEFVILFPETPLSGGLIIAERIRQVIGSTRFLEALNIEARVSASIGIAAYPESADDVRSLISSADQAMYRAKSLGKNRVVAASPLSSPESPKRP